MNSLVVRPLVDRLYDPDDPTIGMVSLVLKYYPSPIGF